MQNEGMKNSKVIRGILLSIVALVVAQTLALGISELLAKIGLNAAICNIIAGFLYVAFALAEIKLLCKKVLEIPMIEMRIPRIQINGVWVISAVFMPLFVILCAAVIGGQWTRNTFDSNTTAEIITSAVCFYGLGAGIVEEIIFRGIIMGCIEKRFNIKLAIIIPSILFGTVHIIGNDLNLLSEVQVVIAGSIVGILFSLIAYESNSVWNNAIVHAVWNMFFGSGIVHIGGETDKSSLINFVFKNKSFILTGGDFGIEASIISVIAYLIFIILALVLFNRKNIKF